MDDAVRRTANTKKTFPAQSPSGPASQFLNGRKARLITKFVLQLIDNEMDESADTACKASGKS